MTVEQSFCIENLIASCCSECPDDLWLEYQTSIPANTSLTDLTAIKSRFYDTLANLLPSDEFSNE